MAAKCCVCGDSIWGGRVLLTSPLEVEGESACEWCGTSLNALVEGGASAGVFGQLVEYAEKRNPTLVPVLQAQWDKHHQVETTARVEAAAKQADISAMPVTSGFTFEGSPIVDYRGFLSTEVVMGMGLFRGIGADFATSSAPSPRA